MPTADYKVLLGDDDPAILRLLSRWLEKAGYPTRTAADGQEALDAIAAECPDFIITDWEMPRLDGLELCRQVRELDLPHYVYVIFLTAKTARDEMITGLDVGADDFLCKPVTEAELLARMRSGLRVLESERRLTLMASTDSLTGLFTQRVFYETLDKEWHRAKRSHLPLSCVMIDLDFFKQINDVYGHPAGDSVLRVAAELFLDNCRVSDTLCRYGGEEFCVMLPETDENAAAVWAERARSRLAALRNPMGKQGLRVTGSFGVAECRDDMLNSEKLVDLADEALLCAKRAGRDRVICYSSLIDTNESNPVLSRQQGGIFHGARAVDVMTPLAICLHEGQTIDEAAQFFLDSGIASTPVLDSNGVLVGFISEKDLMTNMVSPDSWHKPLGSVMRPNVICYEEDTPIHLIYEFLCRVSIHRVVITRDGRPVGTIDRNALLHWFHDWVAQKGWEPRPQTTATPG
jgi:two-component system, cell cycle response regulator